MFQLTPSTWPPYLPHRQILVFALLLTLAQLVAQLHGLEHLTDLGDGQHAGEVCALCILSAELHAGDTATITISYDSRRCSAPVENSYPFVAAFPFIAFTGRAPPAFSTIVEIH
ncbi:MAG: hypothetical protein PVI92_13065 [Chromatiales bacterium]